MLLCGLPKSDCNLPIAHQAIVHQRVFNNLAIPLVSEAQKTRKFQNRQSRGSDTGAINQLNSRLENINSGYNSLRVLNFINQTQPKMQHTEFVLFRKMIINTESQYEAFLEEVEVALEKQLHQSPLSF